MRVAFIEVAYMKLSKKRKILLTLLILIHPPTPPPPPSVLFPTIDTKWVTVIQDLTLPKNKKQIQAFLGKINFLRRFIPNYAEIVKDITDMLKMDHEVKWTVPSRYAFDQIKKAIS